MLAVVETRGRVVVASGRAASTSGGEEGSCLAGLDQLGCQSPVQPPSSPSSFVLAGFVPWILTGSALDSGAAFVGGLFAAPRGLLNQLVTSPVFLEYEEGCTAVVVDSAGTVAVDVSLSSSIHDGLLFSMVRFCLNL